MPGPVAPAVKGPASTTQVVKSKGAGVGPEALIFAPGEDAILAQAKDTVIRKHQVFDYLLRQDPMRGLQVLHSLLAEVLAARVAGEEGIRVGGSEVDHFVARARERDQREARRTMGARADMEEFVALRFGMSLSAYGKWQREQVSRRLVLWYAMVYSALKEDRCLCRVIAVKDQALAKNLLGSLKEGADFSQLAKKNSIHPTAKQGGRLTPLSRDSNHPLAERIFTLAEGEILGPEAGVLGEEKVWTLVLLEKKVAGKKQAFADIAEEVARRVRFSPPRAEEALAFFFATRKRYGLRLFLPETKSGAHDATGAN